MQDTAGVGLGTHIKVKLTHYSTRASARAIFGNGGTSSTCSMPDGSDFQCKASSETWRFLLCHEVVQSYSRVLMGLQAGVEPDLHGCNSTGSACHQTATNVSQGKCIAHGCSTFQLWAYYLLIVYEHCHIIMCAGRRGAWCHIQMASHGRTILHAWLHGARLQHTGAVGVMCMIGDNMWGCLKWMS